MPSEEEPLPGEVNQDLPHNLPQVHPTGHFLISVWGRGDKTEESREVVSEDSGLGVESVPRAPEVHSSEWPREALPAVVK